MAPDTMLPELEDAKMTPEERLFRVVVSGAQTAEPVPQLKPPVSLEKSLGDVRQILAKFQIPEQKLLRMAGVVTAGIIVLILLADVRVGWMGFVCPGARLSELVVPQTSELFPGVMGPEPAPPNWSAPAEMEPAAEIAAPAQGEYRLVGISKEKNGRVAMIELTAAGRAKFLREGDSLDKKTRIKEIKEYSVLLTSGGRVWEIR